MKLPVREIPAGRWWKEEVKGEILAVIKVIDGDGPMKECMTLASEREESFGRGVVMGREMILSTQFFDVYTPVDDSEHDEYIERMKTRTEEFFSSL